MRVRLPLGPGLFFVCAFLFALVATLPLRLALGWLGLDSAGFSARDAQGSVWFGAASEARVGPARIGDVTARLRTLPLFLGRARIDLRRGDDRDPFAGAATVSRHVFGLDDATGRLNLESALPVASVDLSDVSAHFAAGACRDAEGLVRASFAAEGTTSGALSGEARCDGGALLVPLRSAGAALDLRLFADGQYRADWRPTGAGAPVRIEGRF